MKHLTLLYYFIVTILIPFSGISLTFLIKDTNLFLKETCTRYCHNHGCKHTPVLPDLLTGDQYLYGETIHFLYQFGEGFRLFLPISRSEGYGLANLLIFCIFVPTIHFGLLFLTIRALRRRQ